MSPVPPSVSGMMSPPLSGAGSHGHSITELVPPPIHPPSSAVGTASPPSPSTVAGYSTNMAGQSTASSMSAAAALSAAAAAASVQSSNQANCKSNHIIWLALNNIFMSTT